MTQKKKYKSNFQIGKGQKCLPPQISITDTDKARVFFDRLSEAEQERLRRLVIRPLSVQIRHMGEATAIELILKLGCFLVLNDPENTCADMYREEFDDLIP